MEDIPCIGSSSSDQEDDEVITKAPDRVLPTPFAKPSNPPKTKLMKKLDGKPFLPIASQDVIFEEAENEMNETELHITGSDKNLKQSG